jgi:hypothetical protein
MPADALPDPSQQPEALPDLLKQKHASRPMWRRVLYVVLAVLCFVLGLAGWVIPVVTGIPFLIAGFVLLAFASDRAVGWINRLEGRLPESWRRGLRRAIVKVPLKSLRESVNLPETGVSGPGPGEPPAAQ